MTSPVPSRDDVVPTLVIATQNAHKLDEMRRMLVDSSIQAVGLDEFPDIGEIVEDADTFEGNAIIKAQAVAKHTGLPALADDSGLVVDALDGAPGVFSARYAGTHGDDAANNAKLLADLASTDSEPTAKFVCAAAFVQSPDTKPIVVRGEMSGRIIDTPRGDHGFGYDPLFVADGFELTNAELDAAAKDAISHRGQAMRQIVPQIIETLQPLS